MKIYAVADIHGAQYRLNLVLKNIQRYHPDLVVVCGDITQYGPRDVAKNFLNQIPTETLAVIGNIDPPDVNIGIDESKATNINMKRLEKKGISFVGISAIDEGNVERFFSENEEILDENCVLVTHAPPYNTQDKIFIEMHGGSKELRTAIDKYKPRLVLSGHVHEDPGYAKSEETVVVNCSMGKRGSGALIEINGKISVKMLD